MSILLIDDGTKYLCSTLSDNVARALFRRNEDPALLQYRRCLNLSAEVLLNGVFLELSMGYVPPVLRVLFHVTWHEVARGDVRYSLR